MVDALTSSIIALGFDIFSIKIYWVACSALWFYDYIITFDDEVEYAWKGRKTPVFWLFFLNRYLAPCFIIIILVAYFAEDFTIDLQSIQIHGGSPDDAPHNDGPNISHNTGICYNTKKQIVPLLLCTGSCVTIGCRFICSVPVLSRLISAGPLPTLPNIDAYKICLFIWSGFDVVPCIKAYLVLSLAFDALAFIIIITVTIKTSQYHRFMPLTKIIQRDGVIYFFVLFSSNLVWVLLLYHPRTALQFMHGSHAMIISAIMINRITLNLKKASQRNSNAAWSIATFDLLSSGSEAQLGITFDTG